MTEEVSYDVLDKDEFRASFKYFKSKESSPDFSTVLDFHETGDKEKNMNFKSLKVCPLDSDSENCLKLLELKPLNEWNVFSIVHHPGLIIVQNPFTFLGALSWIERCLRSFSEAPHRTNLSQLGMCLKGNGWWSQVKEPLIKGEKFKLVKQLRWATMGYHHNWDTKEYNEHEKSPVPEDLENLCRMILRVINIPYYNTYKAEAAIVNYYPPGSTLSPHTDHSEPFKEAPLLSFSFGLSSIFLIGGRVKSIPPTPIFLHHGDVMIMTGESRQCYHAVPRILDDKGITHYQGCNELKRFYKIIIKIIEAFKKLIEEKVNPDSLFVDMSSISSNESYIINDVNINKFIRIISNEDSKNEEPDIYSSDVKINWSYLNLVHATNVHEAIYNYLKLNRINLNVRQVNPSER